jgi:hypothetical protein
MDYIVSLAETGASEDEIQQAIDQSRSEFEAQAKQLGLTSAETAKLTAAFDKQIVVIKSASGYVAKMNDLMKNAAKAEQDYVAELIKHNASQEEVNQAIAEGNARLSAAANQLALNKEQADYYISALRGMKTVIDGLPRDIGIDIWVDIDPAKVALAKFYSDNQKIAGEKGNAIGGALGSGIAQGIRNNAYLQSTLSGLGIPQGTLWTYGNGFSPQSADMREMSTQDAGLNALSASEFIPIIESMNQVRYIPQTIPQQTIAVLSDASVREIEHVVIRAVNDQMVTMRDSTIAEGAQRHAKRVNLGQIR